MARAYAYRSANTWQEQLNAYRSANRWQEHMPTGQPTRGRSICLQVSQHVAGAYAFRSVNTWQEHTATGQPTRGGAYAFRSAIRQTDKISRKYLPETSLIVPDFNISVYGSSCNYLVFGFILAHLLSSSTYCYWYSQGRMG